MSSKSQKHRDCPALGRVISSVECGSKRVSSIPCPVECPFNPWAPENYDMAGEIEENVIDGMNLCLLDVKDVEPYASMILKLRSPVEGADVWEDMILMSRMFHRVRGDDGLTLMDRWKATGFDGLNNDQRVCASAIFELRPSMIEIQNATSNWLTVAIDKLDPAEPRIFVADASLARMAGRFSVILGWTYRLPNYHRIMGGATPVPLSAAREASSTLEEVIRHRGGPSSRFEAIDWLWDNIGRVKESFDAIADLQLIRRIEALRAIATDFGDADRKALEHAIANRLEEKRRSLDLALIPPALREEQSATDGPFQPFIAELPAGTDSNAARQFCAGHYRKLLDKHFPVLNGLSPRKAAADPKRRPALITMMKAHVNHLDMMLRGKTGGFDLNPLLEELGLGEIVLPPPPELKRHGADDENEIDDDVTVHGGAGGRDAVNEHVWAMSSSFEPKDWEYDPLSAPAPSPMPVIDTEEVFRLAEEFGSAIDSGRERVEDTLVRWPGIFDVLTAVAPRSATTHELTFAHVFSAMIGFVIHPNSPGRRIHPGRFFHYFKEELDAMTRVFESRDLEAQFAIQMKSGPQPNVSLFAGARIIQNALNKSDDKLSTGFAMFLAPFIRAFIREVSHGA